MNVRQNLNLVVPKSRNAAEGRLNNKTFEMLRESCNIHVHVFLSYSLVYLGTTFAACIHVNNILERKTFPPSKWQNFKWF